MAGNLGREVLTRRQREVAELVARGLTNAQIAERLGISLDGAKWHVSELIGRLGVTSREEVGLIWRRERRPWQRMVGAVASPRFGVPLAFAGGVAAVVVGAVVGLAVLADLEHDGTEVTPQQTPAPVPAPPLPPALASPVVPTLVYVDAATTEAPAPQQIVRFDLENGAEISRTTIEGIREVNQFGPGLFGIRESALLQFDLDGEVFRTVYSADSLDGFAMSEGNHLALVHGEESASIVATGSGEQLATVLMAHLPRWAEGARVSWAQWMPDSERVVLGLVLSTGGSPSWPGYVVFGTDGSIEAHQASGRLALSRDGTMLLLTGGYEYELCRSAERPRVLDTITGDEISTLPPTRGYLLDVFWSGDGAVLRRVADELGDDDYCNEAAATPVRWEKVEVRTGAVAPVDFGSYLSARWAMFGEGFEMACGPDEPLRWKGSGPDCPGGNEGLGFYFRGESLDAVNPRRFLGVYEP